MAATQPKIVMPTHGGPLSIPRLGGVPLGPNSPLKSFLAHYASDDIIRFEDDFEGVSINTTRWTLANGGGTAAVSFATNIQENGAVRGTTGTSADDTASANMISAKIFYGARNPSVRFRFKVSAITEARVEVGLVDVVAGSNKSAVNSLVTPTANTAVADAALYVFNHTSSTTTCGLYTFGSSLTAQKTVAAGNALTAATYADVRIDIVNDTVQCFLNGELIATHLAAIVATNPMAIWARVAASNATSKTLDIDRILCVAERN